MTLVNVFLTCHVSLCLLEPTGNLQIMEPQFHNSLNPSRANTTATPHALFTTFSEKKILNIYFFSYGPCTNIHQFEGCFLRGQVSSNAFKNFNGCIVEYLNFIGLSAKTLENLLFWDNFVIGKSSSRCPGLSVRTAMYKFSLDDLFTHSNVVKIIQCLPTTSSCYSD